MIADESNEARLERIIEVILEEDDFAICGHTSPDGDCIGSTLAMKAILDALNKRSFALVSDKDFGDGRFSFMPGSADLMYAGDLETPPNVFICVDVPNDKRMGDVAARIKDKACKSIRIDHHVRDDSDHALSYVDPHCAATTLIVWEMACELLKVCSDEVFTEDAMRDIAACCYSGLLTDTGRFMFQNTDERCFECAGQMMETGINPAIISNELFQQKSLASIKLEALVAERMKTLKDGLIVMSWLTQKDINDVSGTNEDTEGCINVIRALKGSVVACMLKERNGSIRGSLRSKNHIDVARIASEFGGGGHLAAAGFTIEGSLEDAIKTIGARLSEIDFNRE